MAERLFKSGHQLTTFDQTRYMSDDIYKQRDDMTEEEWIEIVCAFVL